MTNRLSSTLNYREIIKWAAIVVLFTIGIMAALAIGQALGIAPLSGSRGDSVIGAGSVPDTPPRLDCEQYVPTIAVIGRLAPGYSHASLEGTGYQAVRAIDGIEDDLVVIDAIAGPMELSQGAPIAVQQLRSNPALSSVALLNARARDPSLSSCWYTLDDKPAAVEIANRATTWMVENGVLTQPDIDAGGTTFGLTDDPTHPGHLFFSVLLAKPGGGIPGSADAASLTQYVAVIDQDTGAILGAGRAHF